MTISTGNRLSLSDWTVKLQSEGRFTFTIDEAIQSLGVSRSSFLTTAERLQRESRLVKPRCGFYVIIPPIYMGFGAPPLVWYIDDLMRYVNRPYYIALRKAAEYQGATHHGIMQFQVMTDKTMPMMVVGGTVIVFFYRKDINSIQFGVEERKTKTGRKYNISSPELTSLELLSYPRSIGTINNISTVLAELGEVLKAQKLALLSREFKRSIIQRLGYLLDWLGFDDLTIDLISELSRHKNNWTELDPYLASNKDFAPDPVERNQKWRVIVRREPDPDC